ncbi:MAG: class I SAM-dependent methyltransferase [Vampirovibrionales bacterium]|nr:class I SAM-dependent methyltransferase [Vampirovibrionales bacterium]
MAPAVKIVQPLTLKERLESWWHGLSFAYRSQWSWATALADRRTYHEPDQMAQRLLLDCWPTDAFTMEEQRAIEAQEERLLATYHLEPFKEKCNQVRYSDTLAYVVFLEALFPSPPFLLWNKLSTEEKPIDWLDVGCKNWSYLQALIVFSEVTHPNPSQAFAFMGIELDHRRLYLDGFTRGAHGRGYAKSSQTDRSQCTYQGGDAMAHTGHYDVITSFLPFIIPEPCLDWGLPLSYLQPQAFLAHLVSLLKPGGCLLVMNQGADEYAIQADLLDPYLQETHPILRLDWTGEMPVTPWAYEETRYGWRLIKLQESL